MKKTTRILPLVLSVLLLLVFVSASARARRWSAYGQDAPEFPGELRTLSGRIHWKKDMGVLPKAPGFREAADNICSQFFVVVTRPATGSEKPIQYDIALEAKPEPSKPDYFSCAFEMKVPSNVHLAVSAGMGDGLAWPNSPQSRFHYIQPWILDSGRLTRVRSRRSFSPARRDVILRKIGMYMTFELVYKQ